jgi:isopenicillin-N epimerase
MDAVQADFLLNPEITFLNHGSFGACPKPIFEDYQQWQLQLERDPVQFITKKTAVALKAARAALGAYVGCDADDLVFTPNPSYAINIIAKNLKLEPGDEILTTDLEYGAMNRTWDYYCEKAGAVFRKQKISLPLTSKGAFVDDFFAGLTPRTKVIFISQITSMTALVLPVTEICARAKALGLITIVDGAHAPGHVPVDLSQLQADIYTGACHKWMLTPKGSSFLYVRREIQQQFDPLVISWGYASDNPGPSQFLDYHETQGTRDMSAFFTLPRAIAYLNDNAWDKRAQLCRELILRNYPVVCDLLGTEPICPVNGDFLGQMCSIPVRTEKPVELKELLYAKYRIEIPVFVERDRTYIRISMQAYNSQADIDTLIAALLDIQRETTLIN